ncbi:MAG: helix-turn-helix domain-containing protein [Blastocatellia bacterium]
MVRKAQPIKLSDDDLRSLKTLLRRGSTKARIQTRARVLDLLHRGQHPDAIAQTLQVTTTTVYNLKRCYLAEGLEAALYDKPRSGRPVEIDASPRWKSWTARCKDLSKSESRCKSKSSGNSQSRKRARNWVATMRMSNAKTKITEY